MRFVPTIGHRAIPDRVIIPNGRPVKVCTAVAWLCTVVAVAWTIAWVPQVLSTRWEYLLPFALTFGGTPWLIAILAWVVRSTLKECQDERESDEPARTDTLL